MFNPDNKIAVIAAHPDDEILGCGATLKKLSVKGCEINVLILGEGITSRSHIRDIDKDREKVEELKENCLKANQEVGVSNVILKEFPDNRFDSVDLLDIVKEVENFLKNYTPGIVLTHHRGDLNIDHQITNRAVLTACRPSSDWSPDMILSFDILSSTELYFGSRENCFVPNLFVDVGDTIEDKVKAMKFYESEIKPFPFARSLDSIRIQAKRYGQIIHTEAAEAFEVIRAVVREV